MGPRVVAGAGSIRGRGGRFLPEEWAALADWQRELYWAVRKENYELVTSLGRAKFQAGVWLPRFSVPVHSPSCWLILPCRAACRETRPSLARASAVGLTAGDEEASAMKPSGSSTPALLPRLPSFPGASPSQGPGVMESGLGLRRSRGEPRSPWEEQQPSQRPRGRCRIPARTAGKASRNGASSSCTC
ncbi:unnamed protein product [Lepidochelys kempii]